MSEYISREAAVDAGYLSDWYISSVGDEPPVWTDEHINELLNDFLVVPKDTPAADVQPVKHGRWIWMKYYRDCEGNLYSQYKCSCCDFGVGGVYSIEDLTHFCGNCGARMDGDSDDQP